MIDIFGISMTSLIWDFGAMKDNLTGFINYTFNSTMKYFKAMINVICCHFEVDGLSPTNVTSEWHLVVSQMVLQLVRGLAPLVTRRGKVLEERVSAEKRLLSHGVSRGVHINAGMVRPPELYAHQCPQLGRGLKTDKKISVTWNMDWTFWCTALIVFWWQYQIEIHICSGLITYTPTFLFL